MATITARRRAGGMRYTAQIRITRGGEVVYTESETFDKKTMARDWAAQREGELRMPGALAAAAHSGITVRQVLQWYESDYEGASKFGRTKLQHVQMLADYEPLASRNALTLTSADLVNHVRKRRSEGTGPSTVGNDLIWLRGAFRSARIGRKIPVTEQAIDDAAYLCRREKLIAKSKERMRRPLIDELGSLMTWFAPERRKLLLPMRDLILFAVFSGRREEEICSILLADLDVARSRVLVRNMKHPRLNLDTWVTLPDEALAVILRQPVSGDGRIFPYNSKSVGTAFYRACKMLGIDDLKFHDLRHECASWLFERGWDIPRVAQVTGHKSWATLQRYTHLQGGAVFDRWDDWEWRPQLNLPAR